MYKLRKNQELPVQIGVDYFNSGSTIPSLIVAPPAMGKSIMIAHITKQLQGKTLILQPSKELLEQNFSKYKKLGGVASIYSASFNEKKFGKVTYATIGSIKKIGRTFKRLGYKYLIIDEADRFPRSHESMLGQFLKDSGMSSVLGLTATPFKLENKSYMQEKYSIISPLTSPVNKHVFFKNILHTTQIEDIIRDGFWSPLFYERYSFDGKLLEYNSTKGEYTEASVEKMYKSYNISEKICDKIDSLKDRGSILVFVPSVDDAVELESKISNSKAVWGDMNKKERDEAIEEFKNNKLRVIINVNVLSVGFDYCDIDCVILARPTASLSLYYQQIGRGVRLGSKEECLIVDLVGNVQKFGRVEKMKINERGDVYGEYNHPLTGVPIHRIGVDDDEKKYKEEIRKTSLYKSPVRITFGKYQGRLLSTIPRWYMKWLLGNFNFKNHPRLESEINKIVNL